MSFGWNVLFSLFLPWSMGFVALSFLFDRDELTTASRFALAFVLGTGLVTFMMLLWSMAGGCFTGSGLQLFLSGGTVVFASVALCRRRQDPARKKNVFGAYDSVSSSPRTEFLWMILDVFIVIFLAFHCVYIFWRAFHIPVYGFDPLKINALNAKVFYFENNIILSSDPVYRGYPLHVSLLQAWLAQNFGQWHDQVVKIFVPFYCVAYVTVQYEFVKFFMNARRALWSLGLLLTSNLFALHASLAYMDFPFMVYNCLTFILLLLWHSEREDRFLILAAILAGMGTFVKREGNAYLVVYGILFIMMLMRQDARPRHRLRAMMTFFTPCFFLALIFPVFKWIHQAESQGVLLDLSLRSLGRVPVILGKILEDLLLSGNWNLIWAVLIFQCFSSWRKGGEAHSLFRWLMAGIILCVGGLFFLFLCTNAFFWISERDTTLSRLILHFFPLATIAVVFCPLPSDRKPAPPRERGL